MGVLVTAPAVIETKLHDAEENLTDFEEVVVAMRTQKGCAAV